MSARRKERGGFDPPRLTVPNEGAGASLHLALHHQFYTTIKACPNVRLELLGNRGVSLLRRLSDDDSP